VPPACPARGSRTLQTVRVPTPVPFDVAILQSSTMGRPVYEAIGFCKTAEFRVFVERPAG
jgi:hypothetical protein